MRSTSSMPFRVLARLLAFALVASILSVPMSASAAVEGCTDPPAVFPQRDLEPGMRGTAWTAVEGRQPVSFDVEVLGILQDGIWPGLDFILIEVSGPVIDETGGIAAGMSGSPVYIRGKLAGAISYTFSASDQRIGGMTPAEAMIDLFSYPRGTGGARGRLGSSVGPSTVQLSPELRTIAARAAGTDRAVTGQARRLPLPLSISGVGTEDLASIDRRMERRGLSVIPYLGGSARRPTRDTLSSEPIRPGEPLAALFSYGTITYGGVGTATAVCGDHVIAFGHELDLSGGGPSAGMSGADVLTVIPDPSNLYGPWKMAQIAEPHGVIDQDRQAGIRGLEGRLPRNAVPVRTTYRSLDTGVQRTFTTTIVGGATWVRWVTWDHIYYTLRSVLESYSGTVDQTWTITGTADGRPFTVSHHNLFSSSWVRGRAAEEAADAIQALQRQDLAKVRIGRIDVTGTVTQAQSRADVHRARTASSVEPSFEVRRSLDVTRHDTVRVRVPIVPRRGDWYLVEFRIGLPAGVRGDGRLLVRSAPERDDFEAKTFGGFLNRLEHMGHSYDVVALLSMRGIDRQLVQRVATDHVLGQESYRTNLELVE